MEQTYSTYQQIYRDYARKNPMNAEVKSALEQFISFVPGKTVLDAGCAQGRESQYLYSKGFDVTGIDFLPEFIELAKQTCPQCTFRVMDMTGLQFTDGTFDGIWASASFLHIPKKSGLKTLQGFYRVLKPSGLLYVSVMEGSADSLRDNKTQGWGPRHFSDYTITEITELLNKAGFTVKKLVKLPVHWGVTFLHIYAIKNPGN